MDPQLIQQVALFFPVFLFSLCLHEWAHAQAANMLGDGTAKAMGRLSLSPVAHADMFGTVVLPIMFVLSGTHLFFGWAKPVPVNERNFKRPIRDMAIVAAAGPVSNIVLAFMMAALGGLLSGYVRFPVDADGVTQGGFGFVGLRMLQIGVVINLFLAVFNMIPLGPLDGTKVLRLFIPARKAADFDRFQNYGGMILTGIILFGWVFPALNPLRILVIPIHMASDFLNYLFGF